MISNFIFMNGYGIFVWSSFVLTFLACAIVYYKTRKTLKKYEKEFAKEIENLSVNQKKIVLLYDANILEAILEFLKTDFFC